MASQIDELKTVLTQCAICLGDLQDPRCLPCLHSFCQRCLQSSLYVFQQSMDPQRRSFQCPSCRKKTRIPPEGVEGFPRDFKANKIAEFLDSSKVNEDKPKCQVCRSYVKEVKIFCCDCRKHFCSECEEKYHSLHIFDDHVTLQMGILMRNQNRHKCETHSDESASLYCRTCHINICFVCLCNKHGMHDVVQICEEDLLVSNKHSDQVYQLQNISLDLQKNLQTISSYLRNIKTNHTAVKEHITTHSEKLKNIIAENERKLLTKADNIFMSTTRTLLNDRDDKERLLQVTENILSDLYGTLMFGNGQDIMDKVKDIEKRMKDISVYSDKQYGVRNNSMKWMEFKPTDDSNVGSISMKIDDSRKQLNAEMPEMSYIQDGCDDVDEGSDTLPDIIEDDSECPEKQTDEGDARKNAYTLKNSLDKTWAGESNPYTKQEDSKGNRTYTLKNFPNKTWACESYPYTQQEDSKGNGRFIQQEAENKDGGIITCGEQINHTDCNDKSVTKLLNGDSKDKAKSSLQNGKQSYRNGEITSEGKDTIAFQQKPCNCSLKEAAVTSVLLKSDDVGHCSIPQRVHSLPNKQLHAQLITVLDRKGKGQGHLMKPSSVCFNKDGDIVVGELGNRRLQVFDIHGNFKQILGQGHITPKCVVAMDDGNYAIVDEMTKSIKLLDPDGDIKTMPCKISFPSAIAISLDETFIVSDAVFDNINKVTKDGNIKSEYKYHGNSLNDLDNPSDLYICENSAVFVTDTGNHQIKFLDKDLNLMYKFGSYGNGKGQFRYPKGITGNKELLFISDSGNNRIVVYTHSGKYIGCILDKQAGIKNPTALCYHGNTNTLSVVLPDCEEVRVYKVENI